MMLRRYHKQDIKVENPPVKKQVDDVPNTAEEKKPRKRKKDDTV